MLVIVSFFLVVVLVRRVFDWQWPSEGRRHLRYHRDVCHTWRSHWRPRSDNNWRETFEGKEVSSHAFVNHPSLSQPGKPALHHGSGNQRVHHRDCPTSRRRQVPVRSQDGHPRWKREEKKLDNVSQWFVNLKIDTACYVLKREWVTERFRQLFRASAPSDSKPLNS